MMEQNTNTFCRAAILGCACVITSELTVEQIDSFRKFMPEALELTDDVTGNVIFSLDLDDGPGSIRNEKAIFSRTKSASGKATITLLLDPEAEDKAELIRDKVGFSLLALERLEDQLLERIEELEETINSLDRLISRF